MRARVLPSLLLILLTSTTILAGDARRFSAGINLLKPFMGLPNIELEYHFSQRFSAHVFTEYRAFNTFLSPDEEHPDWVTRIGPRYYFYSFQETASACGFFAGLPLGYVWYKDEASRNAFTLGAELGYKFLIKERFYILPRLILTYPIGSYTVLPGFEAVLGVIF